MSRPHLSPYRSKARWDSKHSSPWSSHNQRGAFLTSCVLRSCLPFWTANTSLKMNHSSSRSTSKFPASSLLFILPPTTQPHSPLFPEINPSFKLIYTFFYWSILSKFWYILPISYSTSKTASLFLFKCGVLHNIFLVIGLLSRPFWNIFVCAWKSVEFCTGTVMAESQAQWYSCLLTI